MKYNIYGEKVELDEPLGSGGVQCRFRHKHLMSYNVYPTREVIYAGVIDRKMKAILTLFLLLIGLVSGLGADAADVSKVVGVEVRMSVGIYGGAACYFGSDGSVVYQRVIPAREAGHGMIEKRYAMREPLTMDWSSLNQDFDFLRILNAKRKANVAVAGESNYTLILYFSDGTHKERWAFTDDPITGLWMRMAKKAWDRADYYVPRLIPYDEKNFGQLRRYTKKIKQGGIELPANDPESKLEGQKKLKPDTEVRSQ